MGGVTQEAQIAAQVWLGISQLVMSSCIVHHLCLLFVWFCSVSLLVLELLVIFLFIIMSSVILYSILITKLFLSEPEGCILFQFSFPSCLGRRKGGG